MIYCCLSDLFLQIWPINAIPYQNPKLIHQYRQYINGYDEKDDQDCKCNSCELIIQIHDGGMEYVVAEIRETMDEEYRKTGSANPVDKLAIPYFPLVEKHYDKNRCGNGKERGKLEYRINDIGYAFEIADEGDCGRN